MWWPWKKKEDEILKPGKCECDHNRSSHEKGKGKCHITFAADKEYPFGASCACQVYIRDKDEGGNSYDPGTPSPAELEKLYQS